MKSKKQHEIKPFFVKDKNGKTVNVYIDIETYNAAIRRIKKIKGKNAVKI